MMADLAARSEDWVWPERELKAAAEPRKMVTAEANFRVASDPTARPGPISISKNSKPSAAQMNHWKRCS